MTRWHKPSSSAQHGGKPCNGYETKQCNTHNCPVDCQLGQWSGYSTCTASCAGGSHTRTRSAVQPLWGGAACDSTSDVSSCNEHACPTPQPTASPTLSPTNIPYPVISIIGGDEITVEASGDVNDLYEDAGATCSDLHDGDLSNAVVVMGDIVDKSVVTGDCKRIEYQCTNSGDKMSSKVRTVCVRDRTCPTCTINHADKRLITVEASFPYVDGGATCTDSLDGNLEVQRSYMNLVTGAVTNDVDVEQTGRYVVTYTATDSSNNHCEANDDTRTVVVADTLKPVIGLKYGGKIIRSATLQNAPGNYFALMAESASSNSSMVIGALASAVAGLALFTYASQKKATSAVADLV
jgi:hypothetical protein